MTNPTSLQPNVLVNQTTTYTLHVESYDPGDNLVVNPDFSLGDTGFSSDYVNNPSLIYLPGHYAIVSSPDLIYSNFPPCDDHSPGQGNMLLVNGSTNANDDIWCQTISVTPNTTYAFGAWVGTIVPISVSQLQFFINGQSLGPPFSAPVEICAWTQFFQLWNSGSATTATICIRDFNTANLGNDFALDDIFFAPVCTVSDPVTVSVVQPVATAPVVQPLSCSTGQATLSAAGSSTGPNYSYLWNTQDGNIVSGANTLNPVVDEAGTYSLTVTYSGGGVSCTAMTTVIVTGDPAAPLAFANALGQLDCNTNAVQVIGTGSSQGSNITYQWSTANGVILSNPSAQNIQAGAPGTYQLVVTNTTNGCTATTTAQVGFTGDLPTVVAADSLALTCAVTQVELDGTGSSAGPEYAYLWTTQSGNILSGANTLTPLVDQPGSYTLHVTDTNTGCEDSITISVLDLQEIPLLTVEDPAGITCLDSMVLLDASGSSNSPGWAPEWSTADGNLVSSPDSLLVWVDAPGLYQLILSNPQTGCADTTAVQVQDLRVWPILVMPAPAMLTCAETQLSLQASDTGSTHAIYQWTTVEGVFSGPTDSLVAVVVAPGQYWLQALDTLSGCLSEDSVQVAADLAFPSADAGEDITLDCNTNSLALQGNVVSASGMWSVQWMTTEGNILNGDTTLTPDVNAPGLYILQATDPVNGCMAVDTVAVQANDDLPVVAIQVPQPLSCIQNELTLDATGSSQGTSFQYQWTTSNGNILSGTQTLTPLVDEPGTYQLDVMDMANGCSASLSVEVEADTQPPTAEAGQGGVLICAMPVFALDGSGSQFDPGATLASWTTSSGAFQGDPGNLQVSVTAPGWYYLELVDTTNGCSAIDSVQVLADQSLPLANAGAPLTLTCVQTQAILDGSGSDTGADLTYIWTTSGGNILAGGNGLSPSVDAPGAYFLEVYNTVSGCAGFDTVWVSLDNEAPDLLLIPDGQITCADPEAAISSQILNNGGPYEYEWTTSSGQIEGPADQAGIQVLAAGTYFLEVTDLANGCTNQEQASIGADTVTPQVDAGPDATLTCLAPQATLQGAVISAGLPGIQWSTTGGNILSGANSLDPEVDASGWYYLYVENTANGCVASDSVWVGSDQEYPVVSIAPAPPITCLALSQTLNAQGSSQGPGYQISWTTSNGNLVSGLQTLMPLVDQAGIYTLTILATSSGCEASASVEVGIDTLAPVITAGVDGDFPCNADSYTLEGDIQNPFGAFDIEWTTQDGNILSGENSLWPQVGVAGTYWLQVVNTQNGCAAADTVTLAEQGIEEVMVERIQPLCPGDQGEIWVRTVTGGLAPYSYSLDGGLQFQTEPLFSELDAGAYEIVVSDAGGCLYSQTVVLNEPAPVLLSLPENIVLELGNSVTLEPVSNLTAAQLGLVQWEPAQGLSCADCLEPVVSVMETTTYQLTIWDLNGCEATAAVTVFVDFSVDVYAPNIFSPNADGINDVFILFAKEGKVRQIRRFQVWGRWGELVYERKHGRPNAVADGWDGTHQGHPSPEGVYGWLAEVEFADGRILTYKGDITLAR